MPAHRLAYDDSRRQELLLHAKNLPVHGYWYSVLHYGVLLLVLRYRVRSTALTTLWYLPKQAETVGWQVWTWLQKKVAQLA